VQVRVQHPPQDVPVLPLDRELGFSDAECVVMMDKNPQWAHLKRVLPVGVPEIS
jgi:hypothetical protein